MDTRQWWFEGQGAQVRPGGLCALAVTSLRMPLAVGPDGLEVLGRDSPAATLRLHRAGPSPDAVRAGERVALEVCGLGYLQAEPEVVLDAEAGVRIVDRPSREWVVTGVPQGAAVPVGAPVGLYDLRCGAHLVVADGLLTWTTHVPGLPAPVLPAAWVAPEGDPADAFLSGEVQVSLVTGGVGGPLEELALARLDPPAAEYARVGVAPLLGVRAPRLARWWVRGPMVPPAPGRSRTAIDPVVALAWAVDDGGPVRARPDETTWPQTSLTWHVTFRSAAEGERSGVVLLPLPGADGEPGSATTCRVIGERPTLGAAVRRTGVEGAAPPAIVHDPRTGRRALRVAAAWLAPTAGVSLEIAVRVHRRED